MSRRKFEAVPIVRGKVYRAKTKSRKRVSRLRTVMMAAGGLGFGALLGLGAISSFEPFASASFAQASAGPDFAICGMVRRTCVVDGDTFWLEGVKIRIADIDTPEISEPRCDAEYALGIRARDRLRDLLSEGPFEVRSIGSRDEDQYGRQLRVVVRSGSSLGDRLVAEGLARTWTGRREPWC